MSTYHYKKIDAFTAKNSLGNPAACLYLSQQDKLDDLTMQNIALEHKGFVSEVVYCRPETSSYELIYFSSECEVDFCGHGTIACMYDLIKSIPDLLSKQEIIINTRQKGQLTVYNHIPEENAIYITAPAPTYFELALTLEEIALTLGISPSTISSKHPIDLINAGLKTLIVPITSLADEVSFYPNEASLKDFCLTNQIDIILVYSFDTSYSPNFAHTRVFAPKFGYLEDPATGSGNSAFGYYLLKNNLWDGSAISLEQGGNNRVYNEVKLNTINGQVLFGGCATTRINGEYIL